MDEYQRLMAGAGAAAKKKRMVYGVVASSAVGAVGYFVVKNRKKKEAAQEVLDAGGRFAERDKADMGAFWTCVFGSEVDVGMFRAPTRSSSTSRAPTSRSRRPSRSTSRRSACPSWSARAAR